MLRKRKLDHIKKVNVIPILDAVFIFIFFLLMSAQFIELYEIHTKKPLIEEVSDSSPGASAKSKNFRLKIYEDKIHITEGMSEKLLSSFDWSEESFEKFKEYLLGLKQTHREENSIIVKPNPQVDFKKIIQVIDVAQQYVDLNGSKKEKLFRNIAFESME